MAKSRAGTETEPKQIYSDLFGKGYIDRQYHDKILKVGNLALTRNDFYTKLGNGHTVAATRVTATLRRMRVQSVAEIRAIPVMDWARVKGFGEASLRVLLDVLIWWGHDDADIRQWLTASLNGQRLVHWDAICRRAAAKAQKKGKQQV